jgi:hypothetical protein
MFPAPTASPDNSPILIDSESDAETITSSAIQFSEGIKIPTVGGIPHITVSIVTAAILQDLEDFAMVHFAIHNKNADTVIKQMKKLSSCFTNAEHMHWVLTTADSQPANITIPAFINKIL